jgi:hypothetical protein
MYRALFIILLLTGTGSVWAGTSQNGVCGKFPIDHPKRENQPSFRIACERAANDAEQIQLRIEGEKPLVLLGVAGESLTSTEVNFDPVSVSVRLLQGQPNLYWIRYDYAGSLQAGGIRSSNRRHWVVRMGDTGRTVYDKETEDLNGGSGAGLGYAYWSKSEDIDIEYLGSTLRATETGFRGEGAMNVGDEEPDDPDYREPFQSTLLSKTTRDIDVASGRLILEKKLWAKANGDYLVMDDGITGWLLMTKKEFNLVKWESGEMFQSNQLPDLEKLGEIPSIAACWLYNRIPWEPAHATRSRPPAPPDWIRPDHFAPEHCCVVQTSTDGRRTSLYENLKDEQDDEKAGRLLAIFNGPSQNCYSANLAKDGRWGRTLVQPIAPQERITLGLGVLHTAQDPKSEEVSYHTFLSDDFVRLPIGSLVLVLGQSALTSRIDGVDDRWYYVSAPKGIYGWAFGGQLAPFDSSRPEVGYRQIVEHYLASKNHSPEEEADFRAFLRRLRDELTKAAAKADGKEEDPKSLLKRFEEHAQTCRQPLPGPNGSPIQGESIARQERITVGTGVRLRPDPAPGCGYLERLPLGTVVPVERRTILTDRIDGAVDHWYRVEAPDHQTGWVFGSLLLPFDRAHPEQAYSQILSRYQTTKTASLREAIEFLDFLEQIRPRLPNALLPDFAMAKLQATGHILSHTFSCGDLPPKYSLSLGDAPWMADRLADVITNVQPIGEGGHLWLNPDAYWALSDRYPPQPDGERLAWAIANRVDPVEEKIAHDCVDWGEGGGDSEHGIAFEAIESLVKNPFLRYLERHPTGTHASAAAEKILAILEGNVVPDPKGQVRFTPESVRDSELGSYICAENFRKGLLTTLKALEPVQVAKLAAARQRINKLLRVNCPSENSETPPK